MKGAVGIEKTSIIRIFGNFEATMFNTAQLQILDMMSFVKSEDTLQELKQLISDYFTQKAQGEIDRLWEIGELNEEKVESFRHLHERTPYN